ncbi:hypothetical protein QR680_010613 [Steinernema hermaphroditum]|uniref:Uncharacterized protein n=1 Tax=Steinernema hermaphroditum TaxID=289476 RepID=A0AA39IPK2_9BILA|nr:hypothetical protein QR680_010613 [Steinernema hermaphroditum]
MREEQIGSFCRQQQAPPRAAKNLAVVSQLQISTLGVDRTHFPTTISTTARLATYLRPRPRNPTTGSIPCAQNLAVVNQHQISTLGVDRTHHPTMVSTTARLASYLYPRLRNQQLNVHARVPLCSPVRPRPRNPTTGSTPCAQNLAVVNQHQISTLGVDRTHLPTMVSTTARLASYCKFLHYLRLAGIPQAYPFL